MANSVVKLTIDSQEYDAKLKSAGKALNEYFDICKKGDRTFEVLDEGVMEAVQAMGEMETANKSAAGSLKELENVFTDLSAIYKRFTDEEKNAPIGQEMSKSLDALKARIIEARDVLDFSKAGISGATPIKTELRDLTQEIANATMAYRSLSDEEKASAQGQEMKAKIDDLTERAGKLKDVMADTQNAIRHSASDTRTFDQLAQGVSVATSAFQGLIGAGKLLGIEMGDDVAIIAKLQAAMAVTSSLTTIQNALQKESALMQGLMAVKTQANAAAQALLAKNTMAATAAGKALNLVAKASPMGLLATGIGLAVGALSLFSSKSNEASKETEELNKSAEDLKKELTDVANNTIANLYGKFVTLQSSWEKLQTHADKVQWIKDNSQAFNELGVSIKSVSEAEDLLVANSDTVVKSIMLRARAAVLKRQIEKSLENTTYAPTPDNSNVGGVEGFADSQPNYLQDSQPKYLPDGQWSMGQAIAKELAKELADINAEIDQLTSKWKKKGNESNNVNNKNLTIQQKIAALENEALTATEERRSEIAKEVQELDKELARQKAIKDALHGQVQDMKELEQAQKKLADAQAKMEDALKNNDLKAYNAALKQYQTSQADVIRLGGELPKLEDRKVVYTVEVNAEQLEQLKNLSEDKSVHVEVETEDVDMPGLEDKTYTVTIEAATDQAVKDVDAMVADLNATKVEIPVNVEQPKPVEVPVTMSYTDNNMSAFLATLKERIAQEDVGSELYTNLTKQIADANALSNLMQTAIKNGMDVSSLNPQELFKEVFKQTPGDYIDDSTLQSVVDQINEYFEEHGIKPIKLNFDTGGITEDGTKVKEDWKDAAKAVQSVGTALQQIEDPGAKVAGLIGQAIANIALGFAQATAKDSKFGVFGWIAAIAGGLGTMLGTISAIKGATAGYEQGGIIKGNSYSGDNIGGVVDGSQYVGLNAGELVLTRAMQSNLAGQLQSGGNGGGFASMPYVTGEKIVLGINNWAKQQGKGQLVFSRG